MIYKKLIRPFLFLLDSEKIHRVTFAFTHLLQCFGFHKLIRCFFKFSDPKLGVSVFGLEFDSPIGVAAGFDKECEIIPFLSALNFSHIEAGTVTLEPQPGNPKPRIFRLVKDSALINRMGFPSKRAQLIAQRLSNLGERALIGMNIGKNKQTSLEQAVQDYEQCAKIVAPYADYIAINVSSPNTPELRKLQEPQRLQEILDGVKRACDKELPILVKLAPDIEQALLDQILDFLLSYKVDGVIISNTTFSRDGLQESIDEVGGLSGAPLFSKACDLIAYTYKRTKGQLPIIGVGGVCCAQDAFDMMKKGAHLVQVYTSIIYEGPFVAREINKGLSRLVHESKFDSIGDIIGSDVPI